MPSWALKQTASDRYETTLRLTERTQQRERLLYRLTQYQRVLAAVMEIQRAALSSKTPHERGEEVKAGQRALQEALAPVSPDQLPQCRHASEAPVSQGMPQGGITNARMEVEQALDRTHRELRELEDS